MQRSQSGPQSCAVQMYTINQRKIVGDFLYFTHMQRTLPSFDLQNIFWQFDNPSLHVCLMSHDAHDFVGVWYKIDYFGLASFGHTDNQPESTVSKHSESWLGFHHLYKCHTIPSHTHVEPSGMLFTVSGGFTTASRKCNSFALSVFIREPSK